MDNEKETKTINNQIDESLIRNKPSNIPLRQAGAILVIAKNDIVKSLSHQQVSNRYGSEDLLPKKIYEIMRVDEDLFLQCIALRKKRYDYAMDYYSMYGTYPSAEMIEKITLKKEDDNENKNET